MREFLSRPLLISCAVTILIIAGILFLTHYKKPLSEQTFLNSVIHTIETQSLDTGFTAIVNQYNNDLSFRPSCSPFAMQIADQMYKDIPDYHSLTYTPITTRCNYGFYQEYPRILLQTTGNVSQAVAFCEYIGAKLTSSVPAAETECFRGIGRGLQFVDPQKTTDIEQIAAFTTNECKTYAPTQPPLPTLESDYQTCLSGTFNILGREAAAEEYGLSTDVEDPFGLCDAQQDPQTKARCYGNYKWSITMTDNLPNPEQTLETVAQTASSSDALGAVAWAIGYLRTEKDLSYTNTTAQITTFCNEITDPSYKLACIQGATVSFAKNGIPDEQDSQVISFCSSVKNSLGIPPAECLTGQAVQYLEGLYTPEEFTNACTKINAKFNLSCAVILADFVRQ